MLMSNDLTGGVIPPRPSSNTILINGWCNSERIERKFKMNDFNGCVIQTTGLTKTYKGIQALKALDLKVTRNSICGFLGPNGAGKTTTIKLLLGLARPTAGRGRVFGM